MFAEEKIVTVVAGERSCLAALRAADLEMRNRLNRQEAGDNNLLRLDEKMCSRGDELETPNLALINFKSFFKDMYDGGVANPMQPPKKNILEEDGGKMWKQGVMNLAREQYYENDKFKFLHNSPMSIAKKGFLGFPALLEHQFTLFERGNALLNEDMREHLEEIIRFMLEVNDSTQCFRLGADVNSGWTAILNEVKYFIRDEAPKAAICVFGFDTPLSEKEDFRKHYNELYFVSQLKADSEFITKIGLENTAANLQGVVQNYNCSTDLLRTLNDGLLFSNASSFFRKVNSTPQGVRHYLNDCLVFPSLNYFTYCANLRQVNQPDFLDYQPIMNTLYDGEAWKANLKDIRFDSTANQYRATYSDLFGPTNLRVCQSISEVYCLQTQRKDFDLLPEFNSRKLKLTAIEGFSLKESDILGFRRSGDDQENKDASLDVQGALINNPSQISTVLDHILANTVQKGYYDSMVAIDVDKYLIEEYRESLISVKELNAEVKHEF